MKDSFKDVYTYASQALDMIELEKDTNPNFNELKKLLTDQVNEELNDVTNSKVSSKWTSWIREITDKSRSQASQR